MLYGHSKLVLNGHDLLDHFLFVEHCSVFLLIRRWKSDSGNKLQPNECMYVCMYVSNMCWACYFTYELD